MTDTGLKIYGQLKDKVHRIAVHSGNLIVGDTVMLNPLVMSLKSSFPNASIDYIGFVQPFVMNFAKRVLPVEDFVTLELKKNPLSAAKEIFLATSKLRKREYDLIVDNQFIAINTLIMKLSRKKWLLSQCANGFFSDLPVPSKKERPVHVIDRSIAPLKFIGLPCVFDVPSIPIKDDELLKINRQLERMGFNANEVIAGVSPYSGHEIKNWDIANFKNLIQKLFESGILKFIIFLSASQFERGKNDFRDLSLPISFSVEILPESSDIDNTVPLLKRMNLFICNDSGLAHVAAALDVPTIAIFGPTSPKKFGPRGKNVKIIQSSCECSPCNIYEPCKKKKVCLSEVTSDMILAESLKAIQSAF